MEIPLGSGCILSEGVIIGVNMKTWLGLFFLGGFLFGWSSCQNKTSFPISGSDMEKFINENILLGAPGSEVLAYLKTVKFGSRSLTAVDYYYGRS
jgi:hypothetical protein